MQRQACIWITGAFKTSPMGGLEALAGVRPINLHIRRLVEGSHVRARALSGDHSFRRLIDGDSPYSMEKLPNRTKAGLRSPITEAWANFGLTNASLNPCHPLAKPGSRPVDTLPGYCITWDNPTPPSLKQEGGADKRERWRKERKEELERESLFASNSVEKIAIFSDASVPLLPHQAVAAWRIWYNGTLYQDWCAAGLTTSSEVELMAIAKAINEAEILILDEVKEIHVFADSKGAFDRLLDPTHHSGQESSLLALDTLLPWLKEPGNQLVYHVITPGVTVADHDLCHIQATSTKVEAGGNPYISADRAKRDSDNRAQVEWETLFLKPAYRGNHFFETWKSKKISVTPTVKGGGSWLRHMKKKGQKTTSRFC